MSKPYSTKSLKSIASFTLISVALGISACSGPVDPDVKARQDIMKNYGDTMKVIGGMVKEPDTFDAGVVKEQAAFLAEESKNPWQHFENQEAVGNAKEAVWADKEAFLAESENFQKVTAELNTAAQTATSVADIESEFGAVGKNCKSCHTDFQVKKDD